MKKIILSLCFACILAIGATYSTGFVSAACYTLDCSTPASSSKTCTKNATLGSDGHCHCNEGFTKALETDADGRPHSCLEGEEEAEGCPDIETAYATQNTEYTSAQQRLTTAQTSLTTASTEYQSLVAQYPTKVVSIGTLDYSTCTNEEDVVGCSDEQSEFSATSMSSTGTSCTDLSKQCDNLDALVTSTNEAGCIFEAQAKQFRLASKKIRMAAGAPEDTTTTTDTATTTATTTTSVATSTATTTTSTSNPIFVIGLSPNSIKQGDSFTVSATISSSTVQKYSISASKDGVNLGNLLTSATPSTTARPTSISQSFNTSSSILTGTYLIQISNDSNFTQNASAYLTINSKTSTTTGSFTQTSSTSNSTTNSTANTTSSTLGKVIFLSPALNSVQKKSSSSMIHWGYNNYVSGNIELYVQTICANGSVGCYPLTSLIANNIPVKNVYYTWTVPSSIPANSYAILIAKQGATVLGYSSNFIITN